MMFAMLGHLPAPERSELIGKALQRTASRQNSMASTILGFGMEKITDQHGKADVAYVTPIHEMDRPPMDLGQTSG